MQPADVSVTVALHLPVCDEGRCLDRFELHHPVRSALGRIGRRTDADGGNERRGFNDVRVDHDGHRCRQPRPVEEGKLLRVLTVEELRAMLCRRRDNGDRS